MSTFDTVKIFLALTEEVYWGLRSNSPGGVLDMMGDIPGALNTSLATGESNIVSAVEVSITNRDGLFTVEPGVSSDSALSPSSIKSALESILICCF